MSRYERRHRQEEDDNRAAPQRDRDRILYSSAFKRLGGVTQVVPALEGSRFHNRLTHSLKVAQVARRSAELLSREQPDLCDALGGLDPDVVEAAGLAHDLGHPPFGHTGEQVIDRLLVENGVADGFEGNPQSFRIVTKLALRYEDLRGLNLTRAVLRAILKYPWFRATAGPAERKWGAYRSEEDDLQFALEFGADPAKKSLEAEVMDWADDIAYAIHDVEDFFRVGLVPLDRLRTSGDERGRFLIWVAERWRRTDKLAGRDIDDLDGLLLDILTLFPITEAYVGTHAQRVGLRNFTSVLIGRYVQAAAVDDDGLAPEAFAVEEVDLLKELTRYYVIEERPLAVQRRGQEELLTDLFEILSDAADEGAFNLFPDPFREYLYGIEAPGDERARFRIVADCLAGLTEQEVISLHGTLTGRRMGSAIDAR